MEKIFYVFDLLCILVKSDEIKQDNPISESGSHFSTWPLFNRPSIQVGTLKAHLIKKFSEIDIVVNGEGELPLSRLVSCLTGG